MKQFSDLSAAAQATVVALFCKAADYQDFVLDGMGAPTTTPNPETKGQFTRRLAQEWIVRIALQQRARDAGQTAASDADL